MKTIYVLCKVYPLFYQQEQQGKITSLTYGKDNSLEKYMLYRRPQSI